MEKDQATILIVDDDAINRRLLEGILKPRAYDTMSAASGEETLFLVEGKAPDLILLDVMMPGMSGFEVAERLKSDDRFRNIPIIMITALTDPQSRLIALNNGAEEFLNKPVDRAELLARVRNLLRLKKYQDFLATNYGIVEEELSSRTAQLAAVSQRLTETQEQLVQSERLASIGQLAAGVAHEINNPIAYVTSNLGALEKALRDIFRVLDAYLAIEGSIPRDAPVLAELKRLKEEVDLEFLRDDALPLIGESKEGVSRVRSIVQNLMDFSHPDGADDWSHCDLHQGLDAALNLVRSTLNVNAELVKEYGDIPPVECVQAKLNQVFLNLMANATDAVAQGPRGRISLRTGMLSENVFVEVTDTGQGIAQENLKRIFDPFFTTKPVGSGTGLGLSIAYGIVRQHGGRIEVDSEIGKGTTFRVLIPLKRAETTAQSAPAPEGP